MRDDSRTRTASQTRIQNRKEAYTPMGIKMDARQYIRIRGANENNLKISTWTSREMNWSY